MENFDIGPVTEVIEAVNKYLSELSDAAHGSGPSLLDYTDIMGLVEGLDRGQMRALLWVLMPRLLQGAADVEMARARLAKSTMTMRLKLPSLSSMEILTKAPVEKAVEKSEDPFDATVPTWHGALIRESASFNPAIGDKEDFLVLYFSAEDVTEWFAEWLDLQGKSCRGISFGLVEALDLDRAAPFSWKSRGWRGVKEELFFRWDGGTAFFSRVVPIYVTQEEPGGVVRVMFLIKGEWNIKIEEFVGQKEDDYPLAHSVDYETEEEVDDPREPDVLYDHDEEADDDAE